MFITIQGHVGCLAVGILLYEWVWSRVWTLGTKTGWGTNKKKAPGGALGLLGDANGPEGLDGVLQADCVPACVGVGDFTGDAFEIGHFQSP